MSNQQAFLRFKELLETRQTNHDPDRDIRRHVLSLTSRKVGFGYVSKGLRQNFGANLPRLFEKAVAADEPGIDSADGYVVFGTVFQNAEHSHKGAVRLFEAAPPNREVLFAESGFLATTHSWSHSFREGNRDYACLGFVYDDIAHYFMADYSNRLNRKLNSDETPSAKALARAEAALARIVSQRISKYNAQPMRAPVMTDGYARRVLVCDQTYADASTVYGKVGDAEFERMLLAAIAENPDAEILVKTHPDTFWEKEKRTGYYAHLNSTGRVRILRDPVNPYALFDLVDTVYVGTSQMGLEALFAGKNVVTFGAPFYAGWGLTDDRQAIPHRHRARSLVEIFHYFYIWYTIYHLPDHRGPAQIEDVLGYIEKKRPFSLLPSVDERDAAPKVSVIIPVHDVARYIEACIGSVQNQTLREIEIIPVNDCSPDDSQAIIERLATDDPRIRPIILRENSKQGVARNKGLKAARGKYVWLLDGDDWLSHNDVLRALHDRAEADELDMLRARKSAEVVFDEADTLLQERQDSTEQYFSEAVRKTTFAETPQLLHNRHCWTWLYRRDFLTENDIRFVTPQWEERAFMQRALVKAKAIGLSTVEGPSYRIRANSTARRQRGPRDFEMMRTNFHSTFSSYLEEGAGERSHPLRHHLNFQLSQFLEHMLLIAGPYRHYRGEGEAAEREFVLGLKAELDRCDFRPGDFVSTMHRLSARHLKAQAYPLMIAAIRAVRMDVLRRCVDLAPIPQDLLYRVLLQEPGDDAKRDLQGSLSRYARNERVRTVPPSATPAASGQKPRIVVHIGATKTGSTYLQHLFEANRPALLRQGIWFPEVGLFWQEGRPHKQAGHANFTRAAVRGDRSLHAHIQRGIELLEGRVHTILLSSEAFFLHENAPALADYLSGHPMEMIVYLRRQDEWANSQYCEFVAGGAVGRVDMTIDNWLAEPATRRRLDYTGSLDAWRAKLGANNVHVRVFDRSQFHNGDLTADFAEATRLPQLLEMPRPERALMNEARLSSSHVELLRLYNERPFASPAAYLDFVEEAGTAVSNWRQDRGLPQSKPWMLTDAQAEALMREHDGANSIVARDYLARPDGKLFGPRGEIPEQVSISLEEMALVAEIYRRHAPLKTELEVSKPDTNSEPKVKEVAPPPAPETIEPRVVNYGLFGWRLWILTPIFATVYVRRVSPEKIREFLTEPADFSERHWSSRRPVLARLLYPQDNPMGPGGIFALSIPVMHLAIRLRRRPEMRDSFDKRPIPFVRGMRNPMWRAIGRILFPLGEIRQPR